jgi:hypothetical protein
MGKAGDGVLVAPWSPATTVAFGATKAATLEETPTQVHQQGGAVERANPCVITRCHGSARSMPAHAQYLS